MWYPVGATLLKALFAPFHLNSEQLADPNFRIPTPIANELVKHALRLTGEPTLGFPFGYPDAYLDSWFYWLCHYDWHMTLLMP